MDRCSCREQPGKAFPAKHTRGPEGRGIGTRGLDSGPELFDPARICGDAVLAASPVAAWREEDNAMLVVRIQRLLDLLRWVPVRKEEFHVLEAGAPRGGKPVHERNLREQPKPHWQRALAWLVTPITHLRAPGN